MNLVKNEKLENNSHELQFSIDAEAFNAAIAKAFKREAGKYNIPGFRKGKAPRHMICPKDVRRRCVPLRCHQ